MKGKDLFNKLTHDHSRLSSPLLILRLHVLLKIAEKRVGKGLLGSDALLGQIGQHLQQQVQEVVLVAHTLEVLLQTDSLESAEGIEQTGIEGHSLLVFLDFFAVERPQDPEDGKQLIPLGFPLENGRQQKQLGHDASNRPNVNCRRVFGKAKDKLRRPIIPGDYIGRVFAIRVDDLTAPKVTDLDHSILRQQDVLRLEVPMRNILLMNVLQTV